MYTGIVFTKYINSMCGNMSIKKKAWFTLELAAVFNIIIKFYLTKINNTVGDCFNFWNHWKVDAVDQFTRIK